MTIVRMPEVATGTGSAAIQTWLVGVGDTVSAGQAIVEIETEKAVVDYEIELDGIFAGPLLAEGESATWARRLPSSLSGGRASRMQCKKPAPRAWPSTRLQAVPRRGWLSQTRRSRRPRDGRIQWSSLPERLGSPPLPLPLSGHRTAVLAAAVMGADS